MVAASSWTPPPDLDEYVIKRRLGGGGMGDVYLAHDTLLDRPVAIKFISALNPSEEVRQRFVVEARAAARLQHPNVVSVHRIGELGRRPYIVTEYVQGRSLSALGAPLPHERVVEIALGLARGLAAAHRRGVLHRDIKPANVIVSVDGTVKLVDFGLAKMLAETDSAADTEGEEHHGEALPSAPTDTTAPDGTDETDPADDSARRALSVGGEVPAASPTPPDLTRDGAIMGTPRYMPPEAWRAEPPTKRSDVWSLGALLHQLCSGATPFGDLTFEDLQRAVPREDAPALAARQPDVDPRFAAIVDRCLRRDPSERFASADDVLDALERLSPGAPSAIPAGNPYRGLQAFLAEDRSLFFGRRGEVREVVERLRLTPFVVVAGDSGVGKSSLCRAGVLPALDGAVLERRTWKSVAFLPGPRPVATLAAALASRLGSGERVLEAIIRARPAALASYLRETLGPEEGLTVYVDQLEELVTLSDPADRDVVATALASLALGAPGTRLLASVRGDFVTRVALLPEIGEHVARSLFVLGPIDGERLRDVVVGPADVAGFRFESEDLVREIVSSASADGSAGVLPLLQFTLAQLWERRDPRTGMVTSASLHELGGVRGALSRHADAAIFHLPADVRAAARRLLLRLVSIDGTRARRGAEELALDREAPRAALDALVRARLVVGGEGPEGPSYEVAHEVLVTGWATLASWLSEAAESRALLQRMEAAAREWRRLGRRADVLWSRRQLEETARLADDELSASEREFRDASWTEVRRHRRLRGAGAVGAVALLGLLYGGIRVQNALALNRRVEATADRGRAASRDARAQMRQLRELRDRAFSAFDAGMRDEGEARWRTATAAARTVERRWMQAARALEAAVVLDGTRRDLRSSLAAALDGRARLAALEHDPATVDELRDRLRLYDAEREAAWRAPGLLEVRSTPPGATASLLTPDRGTVRLGLTPVGRASLAPGTYVLELGAPGRAKVLLPLEIAAGARVATTVDLPDEGSVPAGFVHVPAGRFWFGSAGDEVRRQFYTSAPIHARSTGSFLIHRHETTFADWIAFLRDLAPAERRRHSIQVGAPGQQESVALQETAAGDFELELQPRTRPYRGRPGEPIRYEGRGTRAVQDWTRMPVTGVSWDDAERYLAWLRETRRVPGARFCTEVEWERAARGADGREYPHGDRLGVDDANHDATYGRRPEALGPDEVGSHPASASPFGVEDMSGNVWEWVRSSLDPGQHVLRGGGFEQDASTLRIVNRTVVEPSLRDFAVGLRVCATPPP